jgi:GH15 family glucan-1,4-alpha-glucosidase
VTYRPIHDYGIVGDMNSCALISLGGSIDWACFPRFDSPSVFAAILDDTRGGRFSIAPAGEHSETQRYLPDTTVLETTFSTPDGGVATVTDFMTNSSVRSKVSPHEIIRIVRGVQGTVRMMMVFEPRFDYGRGITEVTLERNGAMAHCEGESLGLLTKLPLTLEPSADGGQHVEAAFAVHEGESVELAAAYGVRRVASIGTADAAGKLTRAVRIGQGICAKIDYDGMWRDDVIRSFLTLHLLTFEPTGAIVAAPTTSIPEFIGGGRNWDYRFSWLRDSAWTVGILFRLGDPHEGNAFVEWIMNQCWLGIESMQVLYGISPTSVLDEVTLDHLEGYRGSGPVRIGNGAAHHKQLDVFGEIALSLATYYRHHGELSDNAWALVVRVADLAAELWHTTDRGIWEVRGQEQHFVYSKLMCWVALDRAAALAETHGDTGSIDRWRREAEAVRAEILTKGWSEDKQSFVQAYGTDAVDASCLIMPFVGFLPRDDDRIRSTVACIRRELAHGPFVRRYIPDETDDGFDEGEGAFYMLSFWLIGALLAIGETDEALAMFEEVHATANHLGLFAEMIDPVTRTALGNFPQAFSHIGLIHTARNLSDRLRAAEESEEILG